MAQTEQATPALLTPHPLTLFPFPLSKNLPGDRSRSREGLVKIEGFTKRSDAIDAGTLAITPVMIKLLKRIYLKIRYYLGGLFYLKYALATLLYSLERDRLERNEPKPPQAEPFANPGKLLTAETTATGAIFYFDRAELELFFLSDDLVRVDWKPGISPVPYAIFRQEWPPVETTLEDVGDSWQLCSAELTIKINLDGGIVFTDKTGQMIREEMPPERKGEGWCDRARLRSEECIYGLGERASSLNLRRASDVEL